MKERFKSIRLITIPEASPMKITEFIVSDAAAVIAVIVGARRIIVGESEGAMFIGALGLLVMAGRLKRIESYNKQKD